MTVQHVRRRIEDLEHEDEHERLYVCSIRFHPSACGGMGSIEEHPMGPYCEHRSLMVDDGSPKGRRIRPLELGELVEGVRGGMTPWEYRDLTSDEKWFLFVSAVLKENEVDEQRPPECARMKNREGGKETVDRDLLLEQPLKLEALTASQTRRKLLTSRASTYHEEGTFNV